jgi:hypothetical protein
MPGQWAVFPPLPAERSLVSVGINMKDKRSGKFSRTLKKLDKLL